MRKRILSTLLALALCLSLLPTAAFATATEPNPAGTSIFEVTRVNSGQEVTEYYAVLEALAYFIQQPTTTKIKLLYDIEFTGSSLDIFNGRPVTISGTLVLDLNGHEVNLNTDVEVWNSLTVIDSGKGGALTAKTLRVVYDESANRSGNLTLSGGTVNCPIDVASGTLRVSGGEASDTVTIADKEGNGVTVTGGKLDELVIECADDGVSMDISGGTIGTLEVTTATAGDIRGGTFGAIRVTGSNSSQVSAVDFLRTGYAFFDQSDKLVNARLTPTVKNVTVKAHTCTFPANAAWCDCGRLAKDAATAPTGAIAMADYGNYVNYITEVTELAGLFGDDSLSSFTLKLLANVELPKDGSYACAYINAPVTLDLNGHELTTDMLYLYSGSLTVMDSGKDGTLVISNSFRIEMGAAMTLNSGTVQYVRSDDDDGVQVMGTMTINGGTFNCTYSNLMVYTTGGLTVNDGELTLDGYIGAKIYLVNDFDTVSSLSAIALNDEPQDTTHAEDAGDTMRVNGGKVHLPIEVDPGATLTVTGGEITALESTVTKDNTEFPNTPGYWHGGVRVYGGRANISGGKIRVMHVTDKSKGKVALSGGSFDAIWMTTSSGFETLAEFLADGYAYHETVDGTEQVVNAYEFGLNNVTVKPHTHDYGTSDTPTACACGSEIKNWPVEYIDAYGKTQYCTDYKVISSSTAIDGTFKSAGWYVVEGNVSMESSLFLLPGNNADTAHIILCDGANLTVKGQVRAVGNSDDINNTSIPVNLTLYGQENGTGTMTVKGIDNRTATDSNNKAGVVVKNLTVNGGALEIESTYTDKNTTADTVGYGLYATGSVTVNGGRLKTSVTADSTTIKTSYGICVKNGDLTVNGGEVTAASGKATEYSYGIRVKGTMTVNGGAVETTGGEANNFSYGLSASALTLKSGTVTAVSGAASEESGCSRAVTADYSLSISGGTLTAQAAKNAKQSCDLYGTTFTMTGGMVRRSTTADAVTVYNESSLRFEGGSLKLAEGSVLKVIYIKATADFGDLLSDGLGYDYGVADTGDGTPITFSPVPASAVSYTDDDMLCMAAGNFSIYVRERGTDAEQKPVPYLDEKGDPKTCTIYTELTQEYVNDNCENDGTYLELADSWYVVRGKVTVNGNLHFPISEGRLILCNGAELTVNGQVSSIGNLSIYAQPEKTGETTGKLTVTTSGENREFVSGLYAANMLTINGGDISATAKGKNCYSYGILAPVLTINGGKVTAAGKRIDDTPEFYYHTSGVYTSVLTVNDGELNATSGAVSTTNGVIGTYGICVDVDRFPSLNLTPSMTVNGGTVTATAGTITATSNNDSAQIVVNSDGICMYANDLIINGGKVIATAGNTTATIGHSGENAVSFNANNCGVGLYGGDLIVNGGDLTANGGKVTMTLNDKADSSVAYSFGICGGSYWDSDINGLVHSDVEINGGTVNATGGQITVTNNGNVPACAESYGFVSAHKVEINGGTVNATGGTTSITNSKTLDYETAKSYGFSSSDYGHTILNGGTFTTTGGKASSNGWTDSTGAYVTCLDIYSGTMTVQGDRDVDGYDLIAGSATGNTPEDDPVEIHLYGGKVQSSADGGAVLFYALGNQDTVVYGGTMKLAKGSQVYTLTTANGVKLTDLLDSGCYYSKKVTAYSGETETVTKTKLTDTDLSRNTLTGEYEWNSTSQTGRDVFYTVDADTSNSGGSSSSGSSSSSSNPTVSTDTATNPDGSTTKTEVKKDGTVIETTKKPDGSTVKTETKTETKKDGTTIETVTETTTSASGAVTKSETTTTTKTDENGKTSTTEVTKTTTSDGSSSTTTTVTDANGSQTTSTVTVGSKAASDAEKNGEAVELPIDPVKPGSTTTIKVDVPKGGATIEIPVENPTPGTVVVIVNKDGTETIIDAKITENGIEITLTEDTTIKVIDNSKTFSDVPANAYFANAVKWAAARGITGGITATTFGPHLSCTRAQLVTFLWRAAGQPKATSASGMTDVSADAYYSEAVAWAFENGIVGGYGNGLFGVNDTITRQQMAVILYRFAQAMGMDTTQGGMAVREYKDFDSIADYAVSAMQWAVNAGILQGNNGYLNPTAPCTRAQIVTMLYRLLGE